VVRQTSWIKLFPGEMQMVSMTWFWRLVCEPDCSESCRVNCPGCRELAGEWESQGIATPATTAPPVKFRWRKLPALWNCWSKSVSARMLARLNPVRRERSGGEAAASAACGCHVPADSGAVIREEVRRHYSAQAPLASHGCGDPLARADLKPGEVVLDLGSGGGTDAMAAAARVSPGGTVIGLDSSEEMLAMASAGAVKVGASNIQFLKGDLEAVPLPDESVDVIISNCAVNLAPDKDRALGEAFRVLRPGGRLAISDIVTRVPVPVPLKESLSAWAACIGGALSEDEYRDRLDAAGFTGIVISRDREYTAQDVEAAGLSDLLAEAGLDMAPRLGFASAGVCATKAGSRPQLDQILAGERKPMMAGGRELQMAVVPHQSGGCGCDC
jgi:arsenite methyltransferase